MAKKAMKPAGGQAGRGSGGECERDAYTDSR